ncbi:hypothetical protein OpiT1DRAFT_02057 [Opitutaceae bacterium TAV1]|nr:hypothetical protein OpiT1DRAFT_02057 [Opitutaceae bacterium TAV1]
MSSVSDNNKRIAKNAVMLYIRMAVTMIFGFFMTRELLAALGVIDYGLVDVIGGIVAMFSFLSGTLSIAASRFFNYELGRQNLTRLKQTFNLTQLIYSCLIIILLILAETIGIWVLKYKLVIPPERMEVSFWFFQFSVIAFLLNVATIPYNALLIAYENMRAYAWICMGEAATKLGAVYLLYIDAFDRLVFYGVLFGLFGLLHFVVYWLVCRACYPESKTAFYWNSQRFVELITFSGWNLFGAAAGLFSNILVNVLLNNFFGPVVNAARGVAFQFSGAVSGFVQNFLTAVNPQIIKYYAAGDITQVHELAMRAARMGYFLLFFAGLPAILEMHFVFGIWLNETPPHAVLFAQLGLLQVLVDSFSLPLRTVAQASGRVALYQSVVGGMMWMNFPVSWIVLKLGCPPEVTMLSAIGLSIICLGLRLILVRRSTKLPVRKFVYKVLLPSGLATIIASILPLIIVSFMNESWYRFIYVGITCAVSASISIFLVGLTQDERSLLLNFVKTRIKI